MFCPSCGANNSTEQKFCRSCGMNLEQTALSLLEQFPSAQRANLQKHERMIERFGQIAFGGFGIVIAAAIVGIIYAIYIKIMLTGNVWTGLLLIAFIFFAGLALTYVLLAESLKSKRAKLNAAGSMPILDAADTGRLLTETKFDPAMSVVENTTELLVPNTKKTTREL